MTIDYDELKNRCGLDSSKTDVCTAKILDSLTDEFNNEDLVDICNYFLVTCQYPDKLSEIIRFEDTLRDKKCLPAMIDVLLGKTLSSGAEPDGDFDAARVLAAKAIANLKDTFAVNALLYCLNNKKENYKVRFACADALGKIGDKYAVAPLIEVVKDEEEKSVYLRESAATALGMLGDLRAVESLVGILESKNGLIDKFTFLKERVLEALTKLNPKKNERVFKALKYSLSDASPVIRINAIEALMNSDNSESFELIKKCLTDDDNEVKKNALIALYNMRGRKILDEIISGPEYCELLKTEAQNLIDEYEDDYNEA